MATNETLKTVREFIRAPFAWPGGYPLVLIMGDGECLCSKCARANYRQISRATRGSYVCDWSAVGVEIHWEGAPMVCAHCNGKTDSAYGEPEK